jgi:hypothetical protein
MTRAWLPVRSPALDETAQTVRFVRHWQESRVPPARRLAAATVLFLASMFECFAAFFILVTNEFRRTQPAPMVAMTAVAKPAPAPSKPPLADGWRVVYDPRTEHGRRRSGPIPSEWMTRGDRERAELEAAFARPYRLPQR